MNKANRYMKKKVKEMTYKFQYYKENIALRQIYYSWRDDNEGNGKLSQNSANRTFRAIMAWNTLV